MSIMEHIVLNFFISSAPVAECRLFSLVCALVSQSGDASQGELQWKAQASCRMDISAAIFSWDIDRFVRNKTSVVLNQPRKPLRTNLFRTNRSTSLLKNTKSGLCPSFDVSVLHHFLGPPNNFVGPHHWHQHFSICLSPRNLNLSH